MNEDRLLELLDAYVSRELTGAQRDELQALLASDPEARRTFWVFVRQHVLLRKVAIESEQREAAAVRPHGSPGESPAGRRLRALGRRTPSGAAPWAYGLAAAILLLGLVALLSPSRPARSAGGEGARLPRAEEPRPVPREDPPITPRPGAAPPSKPDPALPAPRREDEPRPKSEEAVAKPDAERLAKKEAPEDRPPPPQEGPRTQTAVARIEQVVGEAAVSRASGRLAARAGMDLLPQDGLELTGEKSRAILRYPDKTRLEVRGDAVLRDILAEDPPGKSARGKRAFIAQGTLHAEVSKQPKDQPMIFTTPHGEATVIGTTLQIVVDADPARGSRLDVEQGLVRFRRLADGKSVDVSAGRYAVAAGGVELAARPLPKTLLVEDFENAEAVLARWKVQTGGFRATLQGRLDVDLSPRPAISYTGGWGPGGGIRSRQAFPLPLRLTADLELTQSHEDLLPNIIFVPLRDERAGFRVDRRMQRGGLVYVCDTKTETIASPTEVPCRWPGRERWVIEIEGDRVRVSIDGREVLDHHHGLKVSEAYFINLGANAKDSVPQGSAARFDNVRLEHLPR